MIHGRTLEPLFANRPYDPAVPHGSAPPEILSTLLRESGEEKIRQAVPGESGDGGGSEP